MTNEQLHQLGDRHRDEFRSFAITLTRSEDRARDLLQDALYLVFKNREQFRQGTNFSAWVKTIIRNVFISDYRRTQRRRELIARDQPATHWTGERSAPNPAEGNLQTEEIMGLIEELPAIYRRAFLLYYRGIKYKDIARMTGVPVGTAKSRVHMARVALRKSLTDRGITG